MSTEPRGREYVVVCKAWIYGPTGHGNAESLVKDFNQRCMHHHTVEPYDRKTMVIGSRTGRR